MAPVTLNLALYVVESVGKAPRGEFGVFCEKDFLKLSLHVLLARSLSLLLSSGLYIYIYIYCLLSLPVRHSIINVHTIFATIFSIFI